MIETLTLRNFRNFSHKEISFCAGKNIIIGQNGKGKSNILEALSLPSNPLFESDMRFLTQKGSSIFHIKYDGSYGKLGVSYNAQENKKKYSFGAKSTSKSKLAEIYPHVVSFHPLAMNLMYLSPSHRRDFFDDILTKTFPEYKNILLGFRKVLSHRNKILKNISEGKSTVNELDFWNQKYIAGCLAIYKFRKILISYFSDNISQINKYYFGKVSRVDFSYISKTQGESLEAIEIYLTNYIRDNMQKEILLRKTLRGPHIDDFDIIIDNLPLIHFASRGEVKSTLLGLLFIATDFIEIYSEKKEILFLLDDILSELDTLHRDLLWKYIGTRQCIISSIEDFNIEGNKIFL